MDRQSAFFISARGMAALVIAMGIGRFAFTPLLPPMQADAQFSDAAAGMLASINLLGYLIGALLAGRVAPMARHAIYSVSLATAILADVLTAAPIGVPGWIVVRGIAGVSSGLIFVLATAFVLERQANPAVHFSGVGFGMILSGVVAARIQAWQTAWLALAGMSVVLAIPAITLRGITPSGRYVRSDRRLTWSWSFFWLTAAYGLEGFGYIISGTFLVAILHDLPATRELGPVAWIFVGCAAIPAPLLWGALARRFGAWHMLAAACFLQAFGIVLPLAGGAVAALIAALLFGSTLIGISSVSLPLAAGLRPAQAGQAVARLTVFYGIGQVIGPAFAGLMAERVHGFGLPLIIAALVVSLAGALLLIGERAARDEGARDGASGKSGN